MYPISNLNNKNFALYRNVQNEIKSVSSLVFKCSYLCLFLQSMYAWFFWSVNTLIIPIVSILSVFLLKIISDVKFNYNTRTVIPSLLLIIASLYTVDEYNIRNCIVNFIAILPIIFVIVLNDWIKLNLLFFFTKAFAVILAFSLAIWILLLLNISLPSFGIISHPAWGMYVYENYFICLRNTEIYSTRFNGIFLEPGHLGMISAFLLYANKFKIKRKEVLLILIATAFTFSLAAYVLTLLSFTAYIFFCTKKRSVYLLMWLFVLVGAYFFFVTYNDGKNVVNESIIARLEFDESSGNIVGDNRVDDTFNEFFKRFLHTNKAWPGVGADKFDQYSHDTEDPGISGYKVFVVKYGFIGTILIFLFYLSLVIFNKTKLSLIFLAVYILAFWQRAYPFWACELLIFITALPIGKVRFNGK